MTYIIRPNKLEGSLQGTVRVPSSKSHTLRALFFGLMGKGKTVIHHPLVSPDAEAMCAAIALLGAKVTVFPERIEVEGTAGKLTAVESVIDAGNSGQVLRFIGALAALSPTYTIITGDHSIRHNRPVQPMLGALTQLGAFATSSRLNGCAPIIVKGPIQPGTAQLDGRDSQPVSALLMTAAFLKGTTHILVENPGETPWIDLTLSWLDRFGIRYENQNYARYTVHGGAAYDGFEYMVPGDWSSAAYPIAAALITNSELTLDNVDMQDVQGDKKLVDVLIQMGANIEISPRQLKVKKKSRLQGGRIDVNDFIDALPILAVLGCYGENPLEIVGGAIARKKESDRIHAMATELKKMGARIEEKEDGMIIIPGKLSGTTLATCHDHRLVLALSVAALGAEGESRIEGVECVAKTYSNFAPQMQSLGASLKIIE